MSQLSTFNSDFCVICQDTKEVLGHSSINCPEVNCVKCFAKGHYATKCPKSKPQEISRQESGTKGSETQGSETEGSKTIELWNVDNDVDLDSIEIIDSDLGSDEIPVVTQRSESPNYDLPELRKVYNDIDQDSTDISSTALTEIIDFDLVSDRIPIATQRSESQVSNYDQPELWKVDNDNILDSNEMFDLGSASISIGTQRSESQVSNYDQPESWNMSNDFINLGSDGIPIGTQRSESQVSNYDEPHLWKVYNDIDQDSTEIINSDLGSDGTKRSGSLGSASPELGSPGLGSPGSILALGSPYPPLKRNKRKISGLDMSLEVCSSCRQVRDTPVKLSIHEKECEFYNLYIKGSGIGFMCEFCDSFHENIWDIITHLKNNHAKKIIYIQKAIDYVEYAKRKIEEYEEPEKKKAKVCKNLQLEFARKKLFD